MGTRGIMGVRVDEQDKLSYCHFDSYPDGWPSEMVKDIREMVASQGRGGPALLQDLARAIVQVDEHKTPTPEQLAAHHVPRSLHQQVSTGGDWYAHLRSLHGKFRKTLELGLMLDSNEFIEDSLFCEWAYIANFDDELFEVYEGFQKQPHEKGRFSGGAESDYGSTGKYYPCALVATFPLYDIPDDWIEQIRSKAAAA